MYNAKRIYQIFIISLLVLPLHSLNGFDYDKDRLEIFAKLLPRFVLMSSQKELIDDKILICLLSNTTNDENTLFLKEKIQSNSIKNIENIALDISYTQIEACKDANIVFMFNDEKKPFTDALIYFKEKKILTVSYNPNYLEYGTNISLYFGAKVVPFLNVKSIKNANIDLDNILFRISKIYTGQSK